MALAMRHETGSKTPGLVCTSPTPPLCLHCPVGDTPVALEKMAGAFPNLDSAFLLNHSAKAGPSTGFKLLCLLWRVLSGFKIPLPAWCVQAGHAESQAQPVNTKWSEVGLKTKGRGVVLLSALTAQASHSLPSGIFHILIFLPLLPNPHRLYECECMFVRSPKYIPEMQGLFSNNGF